MYLEILPQYANFYKCLTYIDTISIDEKFSEVLEYTYYNYYFVKTLAMINILQKGTIPNIEDIFLLIKICSNIFNYVDVDYTAS